MIDKEKLVSSITEALDVQVKSQEISRAQLEQEVSESRRALVTEAKRRQILKDRSRRLRQELQDEVVSSIRNRQ